MARVGSRRLCDESPREPRGRQTILRGLLRWNAWRLKAAGMAAIFGGAASLPLSIVGLILALALGP